MNQTLPAATMAHVFKPVDAFIGGLLIGAGAGFYMLFTTRIAGNSGLLKTIVLGTVKVKEDAPKLLYMAGLIIAGIVFRFALPEAFDAPLMPTFASFGWGTVTGVGVTLSNGCTSGHGLCGLSRYSLRSLVAVPTFVLFAILASTVSSFIRLGGTTVVLPAPPVPMQTRTLHVFLVILGVLAASIVALVLLTRPSSAGEDGKRQALAGLWCGLASGAGLTIGGMVRPSVVTMALSPVRVDFSLWVLFMTALCTTFVVYRVAHRVYGVAEACAKAPKRGDIDMKLISGAVLFGIGWGASGFCPGPLVVLVASNPSDLNALLNLLGMIVGIQVASHPGVVAVVRRVVAKACPSSVGVVSLEASPSHDSPTANVVADTEVGSVVPTPRTANVVADTEVGSVVPTPPPTPPGPESASESDGPAFATPAELSTQLLAAGSLLLDVRAPVSSADGVFRRIDGALSILCERSTGSLPLDGLPTDLATPIIVTCNTGNRAAKAISVLTSAGYINLLNGGGPAAPEPHGAAAWRALCEAKLEHSYALGGKGRGGSDEGWVLAQLFDGDASEGGGGSSTLTYLLADLASREAILIDPVLEQIDRDLAEVEKLGCKLVLALNTHCHADHITGTGGLKKRVGPGLQSAISLASGAKADILLSPEQVIEWANGTRSLTVLPTPGHTNGCVSFYDADMEAVFTGDALLIGSCGRTDFQEGSAETLYSSVHSKLFTLPPKTLVYPAHDYKGRRCSTIGEEMRANPKLSKSKIEFVEIMANLGLPYPKKIDASLPANLVCGITD